MSTGYSGATAMDASKVVGCACLLPDLQHEAVLSSRGRTAAGPGDGVPCGAHAGRRHARTRARRLTRTHARTLPRSLAHTAAHALCTAADYIPQP